MWKCLTNRKLIDSQFTCILASESRAPSKLVASDQAKQLLDSTANLTGDGRKHVVRASVNSGDGEVMGETDCGRLQVGAGEQPDEEIELSPEALRALKEFYAEQNQESLGENWQLSQFWYDEKTTRYLSEEVLRAVGDCHNEHKSIACISCPTLFRELKEKLANLRVNLFLFEYDKRFQVHFESNFVFYDYNDPLSEAVTGKFDKKSFDMVIADPPFISVECLDKVLQTIEYLAKDKILICTGAVLKDVVVGGQLGISECRHFIPQHKRNLANEFRCYSNFSLTQLNDF